jgi:hypothetical protein
MVSEEPGAGSKDEDKYDDDDDDDDGDEDEDEDKDGDEAGATEGVVRAEEVEDTQGGTLCTHSCG